MADNIGSNLSDIIDIEGVTKAVNFTISELLRLEGKMDEVAKDPITIKIDAKGVESINAMTAAFGKMQTSQQQTIDTGAEYMGIVNMMNKSFGEFSSTIGQNAQKIISLQGDLREWESSLKITSETLRIAEANLKKMQDTGKTTGAEFTRVAGNVNILKGAVTELATKTADATVKIEEMQRAVLLEAKSWQDNTLAVANNLVAKSENAAKTKEITDQMVADEAASLAKRGEGLSLYAQKYIAGMTAQAEEFKAIEEGKTETVIAEMLRRQEVRSKEIDKEIAAEEKSNRAVLENELKKAEEAQKSARLRAEADEKAAARGIAAAEKQTFAYQVLAKAKTIAYRFPAMMVELYIFSLLFEAYEKMNKAIMEAIPGTQAYIDKQEKMATATNAMKTAFQELSDEILKYIEAQRKGEQYNFLEKQIEDLKLAEAAIKRKGEVDLNGNKAAEQQHAAAEARRAEELKGIQKNIQVYESLSKVMKGGIKAQADAEAPHTGRVATADITIDDIIAGARRNLKGLNLPADFFDKIKADVEKAVKDKGSLVAAMKDAIRQYGIKVFDLNTQKTTVEQQSPDDMAREHNKAFDMSEGLEKEILSMQESFRQLKEKQDADSVDRIVNDVRGKYSLLYHDLAKQQKKFIDEYTGDKNDEYYLKSLAEFAKKKSLYGSMAKQDIRNLEYELSKKEYANLRGTDVTLSGNAASGAAFDANNGVPNYDKMATALDEETKAKKIATAKQFDDLAASITDSKQVEEAQKQKDAALVQIDREMYAKRLGLATEYFNRSAQLINAISGNAQTENSRRHFNNMTGILQGRGSTANKDFNLFKEDIENRRVEANLELGRIDQQLPDAKEAYGRADAATRGPLSADAKANADIAKEAAKKDMDDLLTAQAEQNNKLAELDKELAEKKREYRKAEMDAAIQLANETVNAIATITSNAIAAEQQQLNIKQQREEVYNQQKVEAINASTNYQIVKDNLLAKQAADHANQQNQLQAESNQLMLKKARADKTAAEASIVMHTAEGIAQAFAEFPYFVALPIAALIAATGAVQYAAAASAPLPQFAEGVRGFEGGPAVVGEAGVKELINTPKGAFWSSDKATIYDLPKGTDVVPLHKMYEYATANITNNRSYSPELQQMYNNEVIMKEVAKIIGDKFEDVGSDIQRAVWGSRTAPKINIVTTDSRLQIKRN